MASLSSRKGNVGSSPSARVSPLDGIENELKFIHFGCWNNGGCGDKYRDSGLTQTMTKLKAELPRIKPEIVLVTGDNYYPLKTQIPGTDITQKEFNQDVFDSGWECLKSTLSGENTYVLLGNHDLEEKGKKDKKDKNKAKSEGAAAGEMEPEKKEKHEKDEKSEKVKKDKSDDKCIIKDELTYAKGFHLVDLCEVKIIGSTMFVMFTSTVYDTDLDFNPDWESMPYTTDKEQKKKDAEEKAAKKNKVFRMCAKYIKEYSGEEFRDLNNLAEFRAVATQIITENTRQKLKTHGAPITNLVFVCHEPLISWKSKTKQNDDGTMKTKTELMTFGGQQYMDLLCGIIDMVKPVNQYYLCADLHQYQFGVINIGCAGCEKDYKIIQNISGTGGAEQDDQIVGSDYFKTSEPKDKAAFGKYKVDYTMSISDKRFGFTKATVGLEGGIGFKFIPAKSGPASSPSLVGGRRRKTKTTKRRAKYVLKMTGKKW